MLHLVAGLPFRLPWGCYLLYVLVTCGLLLGYVKVTLTYSSLPLGYLGAII